MNASPASPFAPSRFPLAHILHPCSASSPYQPVLFSCATVCLLAFASVCSLFTRHTRYQPLLGWYQRLRVKWLPLIMAELMSDMNSSTEAPPNCIQWNWEACFFFTLNAEKHVTLDPSVIVMQTLFTWFLIKSHLHYKKKKSDEHPSFCNWGVYSRLRSWIISQSEKRINQ